MSELEAVIARLDPARTIEIPEPDLTLARRIRLEEAPLRPPPKTLFTFPRRFALRVAVAGSAAIAAVVVLSVTLLPGGPEPIPVAGASQQLQHLASLASDQQGVGPGQYSYTSVLEPLRDIPGVPFNAYFQGTVQTWSDPDGAGRQVVTFDPTPQFASPADQAAWANAGSPSLGSVPSAPIVRSFSPGQSSGPAGTYLPLVNVSGLPTDPRALETELANGTTDISAINNLGPASPEATPTAGNSCASAACTTFVRAWALLKGPVVGSSPDLQSAIYQAMAGIPGVTALGPVTQAGHSGSGFSLHEVLPAHTQPCPGGTSVAVPSIGSTYQVVLDPDSAQVVATQVNFSAPTVAPSCPGLGSASNSPATTELLPTWSVVQASGVVDSTTAIPGGNPAT